MPENNLISRTKPSKGMDFNFLREEGMEKIRQLAGNKWTDHNSHDPGITILEQLCYAITELTYRSNFDIPDLLAEESKDTSSRNSLFSARDILTCNPITELDFRKRIIDLEGVKNFWIEPTTKSEVDFYANRAEDRLVYEPVEDDQIPVALNGLYKTLIEFEEHEDWGDLNSNSISESYEITGESLSGFKIDISGKFSPWNNQRINWDDLQEVAKSLDALEMSSDQSFGQFSISINFNKEQNTSNDFYEINVEIIDRSTTQGTRKVELAKKIKDEIEEFIYGENLTKKLSLTAKYQSKISYTHSILKNVKNRLQSDRNICEDFTLIEPMRVEDILICAEVELASGFNAHEVLAKIYFDVGNFISPKPTIQSLESVQTQNSYTDEIFEGPKLDHGFLLDETLRNAERRKFIHTSDLVNLIMDIDGVVAIKMMQVANSTTYEDGKEMDGDSVKWCLKLSHLKNFVPRLNTVRSTVAFKMDGLPIIANEKDTQTELENLKAELDKKSEHGPVDLSIPSGKFLDVEDYYSVQREFPLNYGVGEEGLSSEEPPLRKAQARQLKGYLAIIEQILANSFSQLANVKELFALHEDAATYFTQPLYDIPRAHEIIKPFLEKNGFTTESIDESIELVKEKWDELMVEPDNYLMEQLEHLTRSLIDKGDEGNNERKNRFLDHLLARFGEQYHDYSTLMQRAYGSSSQSELIHDKVSILKNYPEISHDRGKGFDYSNSEELWDTKNVTGLEKRIKKLLGIEDVERRFLGNYFEIFEDNVKEFRWRIRREEDDEIILNSEEGYGSMEEVSAILKRVLILALVWENYQPRKNKNGKFYFNLVDTTGEIIGMSRQFFSTSLERDNEIDVVISFLNEKEDEEGLHVVEHILLRPKTAFIDELLPVSLEPCDTSEIRDCPCDSDPYSFRISVFLPAWPERFRNVDFRKHLESKIRMEAPAHVFAKICWVDKTQMKEFEQEYKDWLQSKALFSFDPVDVFNTNNYNEIITDLGYQFASLQKKAKLVLALPQDLKGAKSNLSKLERSIKKLSAPKQALLTGELSEIKGQVMKFEIMTNYSDKHNGLIKSMNGIRNVYPYATLHDCEEGVGDTPISLGNSVLGSFGTAPDAVRVAYQKRKNIVNEGIGTLMIGEDFKIYTIEQRAKEGVGRMKVGKNFRVK